MKKCIRSGINIKIKVQLNKSDQILKQSESSENLKISNCLLFKFYRKDNIFENIYFTSYEDLFLLFFFFYMFK